MLIPVCSFAFPPQGEGGPLAVDEVPERSAAAERSQVRPLLRAWPAAKQSGSADQALPLKLSTKCRQLETQKWELPKKFPFLRGLNVKGGIPSPLHNPPMRVQALPHRFVYSLRPRQSRGLQAVDKVSTA